MGTPKGYSLCRALERDVFSVVTSRTWQRFMFLGIVLSVVYFLVFFFFSPKHHYRMCKNIIEIRHGQLDEQRQQCAPRDHIFLLKMHKSGGDALQNMFMRRGFLRQHNFVLPEQGIYLGHPGKFGIDLVDERFFAAEEHFDVLTHHSRFSPEGVNEVMPEDTLWFAVLREPEALFQSLYDHYHFSNNSLLYKSSLAEFLDSLDMTDLEKKIPELSRLNNQIGFNQMAFDAGMDSSLFHDVGAVDKLILQMEEHFDLVLIAEQMERSLVLMADMLCWPMDEVITLRPTNATTSTLSKEQRLKLQALNSADVAIYEHFAKTFRVRVRSFGEQRMANRLKLLRVRSRLMEEQCSGNATIKTDAPHMCQLMVMPEEQLTELIRKEQLKRFNNEKYSITQPVK